MALRGGSAVLHGGPMALCGGPAVDDELMKINW